MEPSQKNMVFPWRDHTDKNETKEKHIVVTKEVIKT